jgi:hypothetical protein
MHGAAVLSTRTRELGSGNSPKSPRRQKHQAKRRREAVAAESKHKVIIIERLTPYGGVALSAGDSALGFGFFPGARMMSHGGHPCEAWERTQNIVIEQEKK